MVFVLVQIQKTVKTKMSLKYTHTHIHLCILTELNKISQMDIFIKPIHKIKHRTYKHAHFPLPCPFSLLPSKAIRIK